jgi:hypothetical protein
MSHVGYRIERSNCSLHRKISGYTCRHNTFSTRNSTNKQLFICITITTRLLVLNRSVNHKLVIVFSKRAENPTHRKKLCACHLALFWVIMSDENIFEWIKRRIKKHFPLCTLPCGFLYQCGLSRAYWIVLSAPLDRFPQWVECWLVFFLFNPHLNGVKIPESYYLRIVNWPINFLEGVNPNLPKLKLWASSIWFLGVTGQSSAAQKKYQNNSIRVFRIFIIVNKTCLSNCSLPHPKRLLTTARFRSSKKNHECKI